MKIPKVPLAKTGSISQLHHSRNAKSGKVLDPNDSFSEDSPNFINDSLAQTMILDTSGFSDYSKTPSFRSHCSTPDTFSVSPQVSLACPASKPKPKIEPESAFAASLQDSFTLPAQKPKAKAPVSLTSYWKIPAALGLISLILISRR